MLKITRSIVLSVFMVLMNDSALCVGISARLQGKLTTLGPGETLTVILHFSQQPDLHRFMQGKKSAPGLLRYLRTLSQQNIDKLQSILSKQKYGGRLTPLWIINSVVLDVTDASAKAVSGLPYVNSIDEDEHIITEEFNSFGNRPSMMQAGANPGWNISKIQADSVWQLYGINGEGVLIGSMDGGVDVAHPSLASKWKGGTHAWFDAINGRPNPYDDLGHGTHTTGTMVGGDGEGPDTNDIGIAYGAKFIAAKMLTSGYATVAQVVSAAQWMLDPDGDPSTNDFPDVINNSWFSDTRGSTWFVGAAGAWRAAGIIPVFCAANYGPTPSSTRSPGDYEMCISVGGTNSIDDRYSATSVGPSPIGSPFPADGRKPDVSAPGEGVVSSLAGGGFGAGSGTSMAAPHVTGTIALMLQANPDLAFDEVLGILKQTAVDLGTSGYDFVFGYGRINALTAVREALKLRLRATPTNGLSTHEYGDSIMISLALRVLPKAPVKIYLKLNDSTEGILRSNAVLEFAPENWYLPQTVIVQGVADTLADGDVSYTLTASSSSSDPLYDQLSSVLATITNKDATILGVNTEPIEKGFSLRQNYPNPFNPTTHFEFMISNVGFVTLKVYDILGREVAILVNKTLTPGTYSTTWDAINVPGGIYFYKLSTRSFTSVKKMVLVK
jgi:subtilisin family serine protease